MNQVVFLVDVDNTLLDNDRIQADIKAYLERQYGAGSRDRYWAILEDLFVELGYRDYLGALQRYRVEHPQDMHLLSMSSFLVDYPFANRLYPGSLDVLERLRQWGPTVLLTDGDVVFQTRKVERSGLSEAVNSHVLIYIHKELALEDDGVENFAFDFERLPCPPSVFIAKSVLRPHAQWLRFAR